MDNETKNGSLLGAIEEAVTAPQLYSAPGVETELTSPGVALYGTATAAANEVGGPIDPLHPSWAGGIMSPINPDGPEIMP